MLFSAVAYTKNQTGALVDLIGGMHGHLRAALSNAAAGIDSATAGAAAAGGRSGRSTALGGDGTATGDDSGSDDLDDKALDALTALQVRSRRVLGVFSFGAWGVSQGLGMAA